MASGLPVNLTYSPAAACNVSTPPTYRPNLSGDVYAPDGEQSITNWFNKGNVSVPTDVTQPFGNAPRNVARAALSGSISAAQGSRFSAGQAGVPIEPFNVMTRHFGATRKQRVEHQLRHDPGWRRPRQISSA